MLGWALTFLVVALIAGLLGFTTIAGASIALAKLLFLIFLVLFVISLIMHLVRGRVTAGGGRRLTPRPGGPGNRGRLGSVHDPAVSRRTRETHRRGATPSDFRDPQPWAGRRAGGA